MDGREDFIQISFVIEVLRSSSWHRLKVDPPSKMPETRA
jgi:hypothetical protein